MVQTLHPGVYTIEIDAQPKVTGVGVTTGGFIGLAQKGPTDKAILVTSYTQYVSIFGSYFKHDAGSTKHQSYMAYAVDGFFKSGGSACYIVRAIASDAVDSVLLLSEASDVGTDDTLSVTIDSLYKGKYYNNLFIETEKASTTSAIAIPYDDASGTVATGFFDYTGHVDGELAVYKVAAFGSYTWAAGDTFQATGGTPTAGTLITTPIEVLSKVDSDAITLASGLTHTPATGDITSTLAGVVTHPILALTVVSTTGFEAGDAIHIVDSTGTLEDDDGGTNSYDTGVSGRVQYVKTVASGTSLTLCKPIQASFSGAAAVASGTVVKTSSTHRKIITGFLNTTQTINASSTYVDLVAGRANNIVEGQHLLIAGSESGAAATNANTCEMDIIVDSVIQTATYDRINFKSSSGVSALRGFGTSISGTSDSTYAPMIVSMETDIRVYELGSLIEDHPFLAFNADNARDYIGEATNSGRLNGDDTNESNAIKATLVASVVAGQLIEFPYVSSTAMADGVDGPTIPPPATMAVDANLDFFDAAIDMTMLAFPDAIIQTFTDAQTTAGYLQVSDYCTTRSDVMAFIDTPFDTTTTSKSKIPQDALSYRLGLPFDTSRTSLFWPHLVIPDPAITTADLTSPTAFSQGFGTQIIRIPPCGHVMGQHAKVAASKGPHVAAANIPHLGVLDVSYRVTDAEQDTLNPKGVNAIRFFPAQGIRTWGARTLWSVTDGRHYIPVVRLLQFVERSVREGNRFAVFQPNDPALWAQITAANESFLSGIWQQGMLFPSNDESQAYFVKCDAETNPPSERAAGRVNCIIGINPPKPAEFVVFKVGIFDGASEIEAIITGANASGFFVG